MHPLAGLPPRSRSREPIAVGVGVEPGAAVELGLDLELFAGLHAQGHGVIGAGFKIQYFGGRSLHRCSSNRDHIAAGLPAVVVSRRCLWTKIRRASPPLYDRAYFH